ncbi:hypothetical protein J3E69DRAFT_251633 [Trichoderma sp. SZMC 28015]
MAASACSKSTRNNPRSRIEAPVNRNLQSARVTLGGAASPVYLDHDEKPPLDRGVSCIRSTDESVLLLECRSDRGACMIRSGVPALIRAPYPLYSYTLSTFRNKKKSEGCEGCGRSDWSISRAIPVSGYPSVYHKTEAAPHSPAASSSIVRATSEANRDDLTI